MRIFGSTLVLIQTPTKEYFNIMDDFIKRIQSGAQKAIGKLTPSVPNTGVDEFIKSRPALATSTINTKPTFKAANPMTPQLLKATNEMKFNFNTPEKNLLRGATTLTYPPDTEEHTYAPLDNGQPASRALQGGILNQSGQKIQFASTPYVDMQRYSSSSGPYKGEYEIYNDAPNDGRGHPTWQVGTQPNVPISWNPQDPNAISEFRPDGNYFQDAIAGKWHAPFNNPHDINAGVNYYRAKEIEDYLKTLPNYPGKTGDVPNRSVIKMAPKINQNNLQRKPVAQNTPGTINGKLV